MRSPGGGFGCGEHRVCCEARVEPRQSVPEQLLAEILTVPRHARHEAAIAVDVADVNLDASMQQRCGGELLRLRSVRLPEFGAIDAAQADANTSGSIRYPHGVAVVDPCHGSSERAVRACRLNARNEDESEDGTSDRAHRPRRAPIHLNIVHSSLSDDDDGIVGGSESTGRICDLFAMRRLQ
jgi:hypothetical protein